MFRVHDTYSDVLEKYRQKYDQNVQKGLWVPFTYPFFSYAVGIWILFFLLPPKSVFHNALTRYLTFAIVFVQHAWMIRYCKSGNVMHAFGIGIITAWGILWAAIVLIVHDAKKEFKRIKRVDFQTAQKLSSEMEGEKVEVLNFDAQALLGQKELLWDACFPIERGSKNSNDKDLLWCYTYVWQSYPEENFLERMNWTADLLTNFRGVGWSWRVSHPPSPPNRVDQALRLNCGEGTGYQHQAISRAGVKRIESLRDLLLHNIWLMVKSWVWLSLLKTLVVTDSYFWGNIDAPPPQSLPRFISGSVFLVRFYRSFLILTAIWHALRMVYCLGPITFAGLLGPKYLGQNGEVWMYPDQFGPFQNTARRGLTGFWTGWWHQIFRYSFLATGHWVTERMKLAQWQTVAKLVQLVVGFALSGLLHASASITMLGETYPWSSTFLFFMMQVPGILLEVIWSLLLERSGYREKIPLWVRHLSNLVYATFWLYITGPLMADDFARGGVVMLEPITASPLSVLGMEYSKSNEYTFRGKRVTWHSAGRWWRSGIAL